MVATLTFVGKHAGMDVSIAEKSGFTIDGTLRGDPTQRGERRDCWVATCVVTDIG